MENIASHTALIRDLDARIEQIARNDYPDAGRLRQVGGAGPIIAPKFVLTLEDKSRFARRPDDGADPGLRPKRSSSRRSEPLASADAARQ